MEFRNIGNSGLRVSVLGLGGVTFGGGIEPASAKQVVDRIFDLGINYIDTADNYGYQTRGDSEKMLGDLLGTLRKKIILATKFGSPMPGWNNEKCASRGYIMSAVEESLRRLKTDWIDHYQLHWHDPLTPIEETLRAMDDLVRQGKVRYVGHCNLAGWQVADAAWTARHYGLMPPISTQGEYNLLKRDAEHQLIPAAQVHGIGFIPYYPLMSGLLTGKYKRGTAPPDGSRFSTMPRMRDRFAKDSYWPIVEALEAFCAERGHSLLELALSWLLANPAVATVITGVTRAEQLEANVAAIGWKLTEDELAEIDIITLGKEVSN